jgi:hypothetical protein
MNSKYIYPAIWHLLGVYGEYHILRLETYLRVKHRGKYYLWRFYRETAFGEKIFSPEEILDAVVRFNTEIYRTQLFGKVNLKLMRDDNGILKPVFELDADQRSEAERLMTLKDWKR